MADRIVALVGFGLGPWVFAGNMKKPGLSVTGKISPEHDLFVEHSNVPKYDGTPSETIKYSGAAITPLKPSKYLRVGYLGNQQIIAKIVEVNGHA